MTQKLNLSIPGILVCNECIFSKGKRVVTSRKQKLSSYSVEILLHDIKINIYYFNLYIPVGLQLQLIILNCLVDYLIRLHLTINLSLSDRILGLGLVWP